MSGSVSCPHHEGGVWCQGLSAVHIMKGECGVRVCPLSAVSAFIIGHVYLVWCVCLLCFALCLVQGGLSALHI